MKVKKKHGGLRKGAGRPPKEQMYRHQINISSKLWTELKQSLTTKEINKEITKALINLEINI